MPKAAFPWVFLGLCRWYSWLWPRIIDAIVSTRFDSSSSPITLFALSELKIEWNLFSPNNQKVGYEINTRTSTFYCSVKALILIVAQIEIHLTQLNEIYILEYKSDKMYTSGNRKTEVFEINQEIWTISKNKVGLIIFYVWINHHNGVVMETTVIGTFCNSSNNSCGFNISTLSFGTQHKNLLTASLSLAATPRCGQVLW